MKQEAQAKRTIVMRLGREKENKKTETSEIKEELKKTEKEKKYYVLDVENTSKELNKLFTGENEDKIGKTKKAKEYRHKLRDKEELLGELF